jgi:hypothetical protein
MPTKKQPLQSATPQQQQPDVGQVDHLTTVFSVPQACEISVIDLLNVLAVGVSRLTATKDHQILWFMTREKDGVSLALTRLQTYFIMEGKYIGESDVPRFQLLDIPDYRKRIAEI